MTRKVIAATLGLLVGMTLMASAAQAATAHRSRVGTNWETRSCQDLTSEGRCVYTNYDSELKIHTEWARASVYYKIPVPNGCAVDSNCTFSYGWTANSVSACDAADAWLDWLGSTSSFTSFRVVSGNLAANRNCRVATVFVDYQW